MGDIRLEAWFYQEITPQLAERLLTLLGEGAFMVRSHRKRLSLSIMQDDRVRHLWIHQDEYGKCYVTRQEKFRNIPEMILYYCRVCALGVQLMQYPTQEDIEGIMKLDPVLLHLTNEIDTLQSSYNIKFGRYGNKLVGAKSCRPTCQATEVKNLRREARLLMSLEHPNIVSIIGVSLGDADGYTLVWEPGWAADLGALLGNPGAGLPGGWQQRVQLAYQATTALLHLHKMNIVHHEIAAHNCYVSSHGSRLLLKLAGFQFANFEDTPIETTFLDVFHRHNRLFSSPPEFLRPAAGLLSSSQADLWGTGLLLGCLFGELRNTNGQTSVQIHQDLLPAEMSSMIENLIRSCLQELPQLRISSYELTKQLKSLSDLKIDLMRQLRCQPSPVQVTSYSECSLVTSAMNSSQDSMYPPSSATFDTRKTHQTRKMRFLRPNSRKAHSQPPQSRSIDSVTESDASLQRSNSRRSMFQSLKNVFKSKSASNASLEQNSTIPQPRIERSVSPPAEIHQVSSAVISTLPPVKQSSIDSHDGLSSVMSSPAKDTTPRHQFNLRSDMSNGSNETLSLDGWPTLEAENEERYSQLLNYSKDLRRKYNRERREKIGLKQELKLAKEVAAKQLEEMEVKIMDEESTKKQLLQERAFLSKAAEERLQSTRLEIEQLKCDNAELHEQLEDADIANSDKLSAKLKEDNRILNRMLKQSEVKEDDMRLQLLKLEKQHREDQVALLELNKKLKLLEQRQSILANAHNYQKEHNSGSTDSGIGLPGQNPYQNLPAPQSQSKPPKSNSRYADYARRSQKPATLV